MVDIRTSVLSADFASRAGYPQQKVSAAKGFLAAIEDIKAEAGAVPEEFTTKAEKMIKTLAEEAQRFEHRGGVLAGQEDGNIDENIRVVAKGLKEINRTISALKRQVGR